MREQRGVWLNDDVVSNYKSGALRYREQRVEDPVAARVLRSGSCDARGVLRRPPVEVDGSDGDVYESDHVALRFEFEL